MLGQIESSHRAHLITLGCTKNALDSEVLMNQLKVDDCGVSKDIPADATLLVIINTCDVLEVTIDSDAEFHLFGHIT